MIIEKVLITGVYPNGPVSVFAADMDKDGDKKEPMKKAIKDKEAK